MQDDTLEAARRQNRDIFLEWLFEIGNRRLGFPQNGTVMTFHRIPTHQKGHMSLLPFSKIAIGFSGKK